MQEEKKILEKFIDFLDEELNELEVSDPLITLQSFKDAISSLKKYTSYRVKLKERIKSMRDVFDDITHNSDRIQFQNI